MKENLFAHGKILLTAEFMILHGSKALAVPLKPGQNLVPVDKKDPDLLQWDARFEDQTWFNTSVSVRDLEIRETSDRKKSEYLVRMLEKSLELAPAFRMKLEKHDVITNLEFDPGYGFGSSSTLTAIVANWAGIDPMQLHFRISRGSGYDVACANAECPILYQVMEEMPVIQAVDFQPPFLENMWLAYLGNKQESASSVAAFLENYSPTEKDIERFSQLSCEFLNAKSINELGEIIEEHEQLLSEILSIPVIKERRFPGMEGYIKSLGAWGGDFCLILTPADENYLAGQLRDKGITTWFPYNQITI